MPWLPLANSLLDTAGGFVGQFGLLMW